VGATASYSAVNSIAVIAEANNGGDDTITALEASKGDGEVTVLEASSLAAIAEDNNGGATGGSETDEAEPTTVARRSGWPCAHRPRPVCGYANGEHDDPRATSYPPAVRGVVCGRL
jgi:hypothetical protein